MNQPLFQEESRPEDNLEQPPVDTLDAATIAPPSPDLPPTPVGATGVGGQLKSLREARGVSRIEVSGRIKFSSRQIEALETEQWDVLPHGVTLRGFVKNYARFLDADVDALLVMLDRQVGTTYQAAVSSAASLGNSDVPLHVESSSRPWGWLVIILVLLFVAVFYALDRGWVPDSWLIFDWLKALKK